MLRTQTVEKGTLDLIKRFMSDDKFNNFNLVGGTALESIDQPINRRSQRKHTHNAVRSLLILISAPVDPHHL